MTTEWIDVDEKLQEDDNPVLISFSNFSMPVIGRYEEDEDGGGNWYVGEDDGDITLLSQGLFVNAWMPLPDPYEG